MPFRAVLLDPSRCFSVEIEAVDWEKYMYDFCWGLQKFVLKEDVPPWEMKAVLKVPHHLFADLQFALEGGSHMVTPTFDRPPTAESLCREPKVQAAVRAMAEADGRPVAAEPHGKALVLDGKTVEAQQKDSALRLT
eukprot:SAG22_NODE_8208_length_674_cov_2.321739_2_plen_135_part_01